MLSPGTVSPKAQPARIVPSPLREGDLVAVVAPSSPFPREKLEAGIAWLAERYRVRVSPDVFERAGYLAGSDARRAFELASALADPEVRVIATARGGYGASRIVDDLPWHALATHPKWLVGFSDVTALHLECARVGVASMHGSMLAALGDADADARSAWLSALSGEPMPPWQGLVRWAPGEAIGPIFGGNLAMLYDAAARGKLAIPDGSLLLIEDCTEKPYRVDRMLTALMAGGHLERVAGLIVGDFTDCGPGKDGVTIEQTLAERLGGLGIPVLAGAPFGHGARNRPWRYGDIARLSAHDNVLSFASTK
jgi:muramoyltetrapeptide carboxypeptidase